MIYLSIYLFINLLLEEIPIIGIIDFLSVNEVNNLCLKHSLISRH